MTASAAHHECAFGAEANYAQIVKTYALVNLNKDAASGYSPAEVVRVERKCMFGSPVKELVRRHTLKARILRCGCTADASPA